MTGPRPDRDRLESGAPTRAAGTRKRAIGRPATFVSRRTPFIGGRTPSIPERPRRAPRRPELRSRRRSSIRRRRSTPGRAPGIPLRRSGSIRAPTWFIGQRDRVEIGRPEVSCDSQSDTERSRMSRPRSRIEGVRPPIEGEERPVTWIASDHEPERVESGRTERAASEAHPRAQSISSAATDVREGSRRRAGSPFASVRLGRGGRSVRLARS